MIKIQKTTKLLIHLLVLILCIQFGPLKEKPNFPLDGSSLSVENPPSPTPTPRKDPLIYTKKEIFLDGEPQAVHIVELDLSNPGLEVFPVLAQDRIFGFELLSEMHQRHKADATVNAGFNFSHGQPSGLIIQNRKIFSGSIGYGRILLLSKQRAWFQNNALSVRVEGNGISLPVDRVNPYPVDKGILIFTPEFGTTNHLEVPSTTCVIENGQVVSTSVVDGDTHIPKNGFLIVDLRVQGSPLIAFTPGSTAAITWEGDAEQGYQCSGSLVENGVNVAKDDDPWAGNLRIPTPRTAVGLKDSHTLIFIVVDGRLPGYSTGISGKKLADLLISEGVTEAAILDGGASSELIVQNEIVNRPSTGKERLLASGFIIRIHEGKANIEPAKQE